MKNSFLILLLAGCFKITAQLNEGTILLNGNVNYYKSSRNQTSSLSSTEYGIRNFTGGLNAGFFALKNLALGFSYSYSYYKNFNDYQEGIYKADYFQITDQIHRGGLFVRYYMMSKHDKLGLFIHAAGKYVSGTGTQLRTLRNTYYSFPVTSIINTETIGYNLNLSPGLVYFLNKKIGLEVQMGSIDYETISSKEKTGQMVKNKIENKVLQFNLGFNYFYFGITFHLGGKNKPAVETHVE